MPTSLEKVVTTFWHGPPLASLDIACLLSFVHSGFDVTIYSYDELPNLPAALKRGNAQSILGREFMSRFVLQGKPSITHFSDLFRYRLIRETGAAWIDVDLLLLRDFSIPNTGNFLTKETERSLNNAIMRIDPSDPRLDEVITIAEDLATSKKLVWGATGPALLTQVFGPEVTAEARPVDQFYPVKFDEWWKPFHPEFYEWCVGRCEATDALHLWNNIIDRAGYWKDLAPPIGSFAHEMLKKYDLVGAFKETCPEKVLQALRTNYVNSRTGGNFKLSELAAMTGGRITSLARKKLKLAS